MWPGMYLNTCWPTPDHVIPWSLFWVLYGELRRVLALERVNMTRAVGHWHLNDDARRKGIEADHHEAFPTTQD